MHPLLAFHGGNAGGLFAVIVIILIGFVLFNNRGK